MERKEDRKTILESIGLDEETISCILESEDHPETLHELKDWSELGL